MIGSTRVISNQLGYPSYFGGFDCADFDEKVSWLTFTITFKGIELVEEGKFIHQTTGKLEKADCDIFVPEIDQQIEQYSKININILATLVDFHDRTAGAAWVVHTCLHFNSIAALWRSSALPLLPINHKKI